MFKRLNKKTYICMKFKFTWDLLIIVLWFALITTIAILVV